MDAVRAIVRCLRRLGLADDEAPTAIAAALVSMQPEFEMGYGLSQEVLVVHARGLLRTSDAGGSVLF